ncbi:hypothetical protein V2J09_011129 [Rumex salicifolius]
MSLTNVKMSEEVWLTCVTHALSTETEEIMGLLLGDIQYTKGGNGTALIWGASPQTRMTMATGRTTRVIGWYHSHPHITVLPSHVDVRTQAMYQLLETGFIGLIFSCFNEDAFKAGRIQVIAFQSLDGKLSHTTIPISQSPAERSTVIDLESLSSSDDTSLRSGTINEDLDTGDSRSFGAKVSGKSSDLSGLFAHADANSQRTGVGGNWDAGNLGDAFHDIEPMDMSDAMQEALHRSNLDMSGAEYVRKEIPIRVVPASSLLELDCPLSSFTDLQRVLYQEEHAAYQQALSQNMSLSPAIDALQERLRENEIRSALLTEEAKKLEAEMSKTAEPIARSPHRSDGLRGSPSHVSRSSASSRMRSPNSK